MSMVAPVTGAWGITWLMWFGASSLALAVVTKVRWLIFATVMILLGSVIPNISNEHDGVNIASVQAPDPYTAADEMAKLSSRTQFVVWPEQMNAEDDKIGSVTAAKYKKYIAASFEVRASKGKPYNTARLYGPNGSLLLETRKEHRFGREVLIYQKGNCSGPVDVGNGVRVAVPICFDLVYPDVARKLVNAGANLLLVPNSDPDSPGFAFHYVHLGIVALRAAENSVPIAWTEINGLATIFTSGGAVVAQGPEGGVAHVEGLVSLSHTKTPYTKYGDWFAMLCIIPTLVFLILGILGKKISKSDISSEILSTKPE
jgi:apolipoprotein N-acyltransferase